MADLLRKALLGGVFGSGEYELATQPTISSGLHAVRFMVIHLAAGQVVSIAEDKREALAAARQLLKKTEVTQPTWQQAELWPGILLVPAIPLSPVSRRRREVFDRSGGVCFYCRCQLSIRAFHVEHQQPRALGGDDAPLNLVAACESCNLTKGDRTALEFIVAQDNCERKVQG
ncbi:MAG: HNH endonuclease [Burkholderiaceae bacterium]|nr:HNH endonuclease [Burkholderiaceae bacterium]